MLARNALSTFSFFSLFSFSLFFSFFKHGAAGGKGALRNRGGYRISITFLCRVLSVNLRECRILEPGNLVHDAASANLIFPLYVCRRAVPCEAQKRVTRSRARKNDATD